MLSLILLELARNLAEKSGKFWPQEPHQKSDVAQWVFWQMANQGTKMSHSPFIRRLLQSSADSPLLE